MKRILIVSGLALATAGAAAGGWWAYTGLRDPLASGRQLAEQGDLRAAVLQLRNAVQKDPRNPEANYRLGLVQLQLGDAVAAERQLKAAKAAGHDARAVAVPLAQSYLAQGKFKELLDEFPAEQPDPALAGPILVLRGLAQLGLEDAAGARATIERAEQVAPQSADAPLAAARVALAERNLGLAEQKVERSLALDPNKADALLLRGQLLNARGDRQGALAALDRAVERSGGNPAVLVERATVLIALNQDAKAKADADAALAADPRNAAPVYLQAVLHARAGDYKAADQAFQRLSTVMNRFPRAYFFLAITKSNLGQTEQAADAARRYAARAPNDPDGAKLLARIELAAGRPAQAIEALNQIAGSGRADAEVLDLMGRAQAMTGRVDRASQSFQQASQLAPQNAEILTRLASTRLQMGDTAGATGALERSLELSPGQAGAAGALVAAALAAGDVDRAEAALDKMRQQAGETETVGNLAGTIRMARLDMDGARKQFEDVVGRFPGSVPAKLNLARVLAMQGKAPDAARVLEEVLAAEPANGQALTMLVQVWLGQNRVDRAVEAVERARAAAPANAGLVAALADLHVRAGEPQKALDLLGGAQPAGAAPVPALLGARARALVAAGDRAGARAVYEQVLAANPGDLDARRRLVDLLLDAKDFDAARTALRDGLRVSPGNPGMLQALVGAEMQARGVDAALTLADQLKREFPTAPAAAALRGDVLMTARRPKDAAAAYAAELKAAPSAALVLRTATAHGAAGSPDQAAQVSRAWLAQHPDDADVAQMLAGLDIAAKRMGDAEKSLQVVLQKRPNDAVALNNLAWVYQSRGDARAKDLAQRAYLLAPTPETADTLGWVLTSQGDATVALPLLRQAAAARSNDPAVQFHLAQALGATGQREEAMKVLQALVAAPGEFDDKAAARKLLQDLQARG